MYWKCCCGLEGWRSFQRSLIFISCNSAWFQNLCEYEVDGNQLASWYETVATQHSSTLVNRELSSDDCRQLVSSGRCRRLLSRFLIDYVPLGSSVWEPVAIVDEEQMIKRLTQLRTKITDDVVTQRPIMLVGPIVVHCFFCSSSKHVVC